ncbi:MAG: sodium:solute symporter family protein [Acidobacteria bacterium]|nr:sodium:solute symporter family protein [Acidobacteriota bacterium]
MTQLILMLVYLGLLLGLGVFSSRLYRGTAQDYYLASHSIGPVLLLLTIFGTTMTAFALVGSSGEAYASGIGVFGMLASWSALVHVAVFFFVGIRLWALGKRHGYLTQIQFFRDRFESDALGLLLFPLLVGLVVPYLLTGLMGAGAVVRALTAGALPGVFPATAGAVPPWVSALVVCGVVLAYIFFGGLRGATWANAFQTVVFLLTGLAAFVLISTELGGAEAATRAVIEAHPEKLMRSGALDPLDFFLYGLIPLSVGTFPHVFQHWLTARSAETFRLSLVAHPLFMILLWLPCVLVGVWATAALMPDGSLVVPVPHPPNTELATMVEKLTTPLVGGVLGAGILAAIMSSLDSQFLALGSIFANDIVAHYVRHDRVDDQARVALGRAFILLVVGATYGLSLLEPRSVFALGVWCFSGFSGLFPLIVAALYWRRATRAGAMASVVVTGAVWFALFRASGYGAEPHYEFLGMMPVASIVAAGALSVIAVSLATKPPGEATLRKFFPQA